MVEVINRGVIVVKIYKYLINSNLHSNNKSDA
jgi:hypothetical protein